MLNKKFGTRSQQPRQWNQFHSTYAQVAGSAQSLDDNDNTYKDKGKAREYISNNGSNSIEEKLDRLLVMMTNLEDRMTTLEKKTEETKAIVNKHDLLLKPQANVDFNPNPLAQNITEPTQEQESIPQFMETDSNTKKRPRQEEDNGATRPPKKRKQFSIMIKWKPSSLNSLRTFKA